MSLPQRLNAALYFIPRVMLKKSEKLSVRIFEKLNRILPYLIIAYLVWTWMPQAWRHYRFQQSPSPAFLVETLDGSRIDATLTSRPMLIVFWATWCGPCTLELKRIQRLIKNNDVPRDSVLAITSEQDVESVRETVKARGYTFEVGLDRDGAISEHFEVTQTPTLVVVGKEDKVEWMTSGLSPTLELRLKSYFRR